MNGIINILKPQGMSSSGVVVCMKKFLGEKRVGHTGTLDPGAAGVLPICVGRCTKLSDYLMERDKAYIAEITFGVSTDTLDSYGTVLKREAVDISEQMVEEALKAFSGEILQVPPAYSAVKIDGVPSYKLARKGEMKQKPPRKVTIYEAALLSKIAKNRYLIRVCCSKGTYIRKLVEDIGSFLGVPSFMSFLLRIKAGGLSIERAYSIDEIKAMVEKKDTSFLLSTEEVLFDYERVLLKNNEVQALKNGCELHGKKVASERFLLFSETECLGIGEKTPEGVKLACHLYEIGL